MQAAQDRKRSNDVLVIGLANVGKTLLVKQLLNQAQKPRQKAGTTADDGTNPIEPITNPTSGFDTNKLRLPSGMEVYLNEVGSAMISTWHQFVTNSRSIMVSKHTNNCLTCVIQFVVDVSNSLQLADSLVEFLTVIYGELLPEAANQEESERMQAQLRGLPILLVFNKADSLHHVDKVTIESMFQVERLLQEFINFNFTFCSALNGINSHEVLDWIDQALTPPK